MAQLNGGRVTWTIDADNKAFKSSLSDSGAAAQDFASSIDKLGANISSSLGSAFSSIGKVATQTLTTGASVAGSALVALGIKGISSANQLQSLQLQMNGLTKSLDLGAQAMAGAFKYAQSSPFQLPDVAATTKTLIAFGITTQDAIKDLNTLGNVSITTGIPLQAIGGIFGQVSAQGKLMLGDIRQLTENGIAILPALQKEFGKTADQVADMATRGEISFDQFKVALDSIVDPTILDQLQNTLPRQIDRLNGSVRILSNSFVGVAVDATSGFTQAGNGIAAAAVVLVKTLANTLRSPELLAAASSVGNSLVPILNAIIANITVVANGIAKVATEFSKLGAFALPVLALMLTSISSLGTGIPVIGEYLKILSSPLILVASLFGTLAIKSEDFRNSVGKAFDIILTTLDQMQPTFKVVLGILNQMVQSIGSALAPVVFNLGVAFGNILIALTPMIPVLATFISQLITALLPILPPLVKAFGDIAFTLLNALAPVLPELTKAIIDLVNAIVPLVPQLADLAVVFIKAIIPVLPQLVDAFVLFVNAIVPLLPAIVPLLPYLLAFKGALLAFSGIKAGAEAINGVTKAAQGLVETGKGLSTFSGILTKLGEVTGISSLGSALSGLFGVVKTIMSGIVGVITVAARGIGAAIFSIPVVGWVLLAITAIVGLFTYFYTTSEGFRNFVNGIFSGIGKFISDSFNGIGKVITDAFDGTVSFFQDLWNGIVSGLQAVGKFFTDIWTAITTTVSSAISAILTFLQPLFTAINGILYVVNAFGTIISTVFSAAGQIIGIVVSTIVQIIGVVLVGTFLYLYNNVIVPVFNGIVSIISTALTIVASIFTTIWTGIVAFFTPIIQTILDAVSTGFNFISGVVSTVFTFIVSIITTYLNIALSVVTTVINGVVSFFSSAFNLLANIVNGAFQLIQRYIVNPISSAVSYVSGTIGNIVGSISNALNGAVNTAVAFVGNFINAGKNVIDGLVRGVQNGASSVVSTVQNIMKGALDAVKNFFGIHSPSTVMQDMGSYIMQGLEKGIVGSTSGVIDAATTASLGVAGALSGINANGNITAQYSTAGGLAPTGEGASSSSQVASGVTIQQNNTINTQVDMDKVVRDLTWELTRA